MKFKLSILLNVVIAVSLFAPTAVQATEFQQFSSVPQYSTGRFSAGLSTPQFPTIESVEPDPNQKFVLILRLNDQQINQLRLNGSLTTQVPPKFVNRVGVIRFQRPVSFLSKSLKISEAKTDKQDRGISVEVDNTILERLAYQPVDVMIYESGFNRVELNFNPRGMAAGKLPPEFPQLVNRAASPFMYVRISSQRGVYGSLTSFKTLSIKTQFGKVSIPTSEIAGIRFNDGKPNQAFVVLKKGDEFSGEISFDSLTVNSRWGEKKLKLSEVESVTLAREFAFLRDAISPKRWQLQTLRGMASKHGSALRSTLPGAGWPTPSPISVNPNQFNQLNFAPPVPPVAYPQIQTPVGFPN